MAARQKAGLQVRLTETGLAFISEGAFDLLKPRLGDDLEFPVPADCSSDPSVCCGYPAGYCRMRFDLEDHGEGSHIEVEALDATGNRLGITLWPRVRTVVPMPARTYGPLGGAIDCNVELNTGWSGTPWMTVYFEVILGEDDETGEMRAEVTTAQVSGVGTGDISIWGDFLCRFGSEQDAINGIVSGFRNQVPGAIESFLCKSCDTGSDCGSGASCDDGVCMSAATGECRQSLGMTGRHEAGALLGPLLGQAMAKHLDLYFSAGSGAIAEDDGVTLMVTSGTEPGASADHNCVPVVPAPPAANMALAGDMRGNTHPVTGQPYDVGAAFHVNAINRAAWAAHQGGYICLDLGSDRVEMLNTSSMLLVVPSLGNILGELDDQPMVVLLRPQRAPQISLGAGTFTEGPGGVREIDEALLEIGLGDLELDFYALIDGRYARLFTVVADVNLGVSLDIDGGGGLLPVLDDPVNALSNISVKNIALVAETPAEIGDRVPSILAFALGNLSSTLGEAIELPELAGLSVELTSGAFTSLENNTRLAMFANLAAGTGVPARQPVDTRIESVRFDRGGAFVEIEVGADADSAVEWQFRFGRGFWSPFNQGSRATIAREALRLADRHTLEVRARRIGEPASLDPSPARVDVVDVGLADGPGEPIAFHGSTDSAGCDCNSGGGGGMVLLLIGLVVMLGRRHLRRLAAVGVTAALLSLAPSCSCDGLSGESDPDDPNQVQPGPIGRWVSVASEGDRVIVAAYERKRGDLVVGEMREEGEPRVRAVDGVPDGPVSRDPKGYRGGIDADGPDVGAWASAQFVGGDVHVAYQDRDRNGVRLARERGDGFEVIDVDMPIDDIEIGRYISLARGADELGISYMALRVGTTPATDDTPEMTTVQSELRFARAPSASGPWSVEVVATMSADHAARVDIPIGIGLFSALAFTDAGPVIAHYDSLAGDLLLATRSADGWDSRVIDGAASDRGQHISMIGDGSRLLVAYQDANDDRLLLRVIDDGVIGSAEIVDDGVRNPDRNHPVGASASLAIASGQLGVAYQDSATGELTIAERPLAGGRWSRGVVDIPAAAGFGIGLGAKGGTFWAATGIYEASRGRLHVGRRR